jgi:hypothetical protein
MNKTSNETGVTLGNLLGSLWCALSFIALMAYFIVMIIYDDGYLFEDILGIMGSAFFSVVFINGTVDLFIKFAKQRRGPGKAPPEKSETRSALYRTPSSR